MPVQTSLRGIAKKAKEQKKHRFGNLYEMLDEECLLDSWRYIRKDAAYGVDQVSAKEYEENLEEDIRQLVGRLKRKSTDPNSSEGSTYPKGKASFGPWVSQPRKTSCFNKWPY